MKKLYEMNNLERENHFKELEYMAEQLGYVTIRLKSSVRYADPKYKEDFENIPHSYPNFNPMEHHGLLNELCEDIRSYNYVIELSCLTDGETGETDALKWACKIRRGKEVTVATHDKPIECLFAGIKQFYTHHKTNGCLPMFPRPENN